MSLYFIISSICSWTLQSVHEIKFDQVPFSLLRRIKISSGVHVHVGTDRDIQIDVHVYVLITASKFIMNFLPYFN